MCVCVCLYVHVRERERAREPVYVYESIIGKYVLVRDFHGNNRFLNILAVK